MLIGTVGLLVRAKQKGIVNEISPLLHTLISSKRRISQELYKYALSVSGEE